MMGNILETILVGITAFAIGGAFGMQIVRDSIKADCEKLEAFRAKQVVYDCKERK